MSTHSSAPKGQQRPWWKEPIMWLVVGGPLTVVIAGLSTLVIAVKNPDPVLDHRDGEQANMQPAQNARNHAASPQMQAPAPTEK